MRAKLTVAAAILVASTQKAFAVFSVNPPPAAADEPSVLALVTAGAVVAGGLRYLKKRKRDS